MSQPLASFF